MVLIVDLRRRDPYSPYICKYKSIIEDDDDGSCYFTYEQESSASRDYRDAFILCFIVFMWPMFTLIFGWFLWPNHC